MDALGERIDADLVAQDVRLTMGGEPTFVSVDDFESPEWNIAAVGPTKRGLADQLIRRLRDRFGPGGLLHYGQGKWYPGESLPRWAFALYWRKDGEPIWTDPALIAPEAAAGRRAPPPSRRPRPCRRPGPPARPRPTTSCRPSRTRHLWIKKEAELPENVDAGRRPVRLGGVRARIERVFERGLGEVAGYVLPLAACPPARPAIPTGLDLARHWDFRRGHAFLVPGDSPLGFRLPLSSLPLLPAEHYPYVPAAATRWSRARPPAATGAPGGGTGSINGSEDGTGVAVRTALVVEPRDGRSACSCRRSRGRSTTWSWPRHRGRRRRTGAADPSRGLRAALRPAHRRHQGDARSRRHRGQRPPAALLARGGGDHHRPLRGRAPDPARRRKVHDRRAPCRHRRRQPRRGRAAARRPIRPFLRRPDLLKSLRALLAAPPGAVVPVLGPVSSARPARRRASTRRATTRSTSWRSRSPQVPAPGDGRHAALAGRPAVPQPAGGRDRQHPPGRDLHRQALFARQPDRPPGPAGVPRLRDAAGCPHEPRPAIAAARAGRLAVARAAGRAAGALGHHPARPLHAAAFRLG